MRTFRNKLYSAYDVAFIQADLLLSTLRSRFSLWFQGAVVGQGFHSSGQVHIKARIAGSIVLGNSVRLLAGWRSNRVGLCGPVLLQTWEGGKIVIGDNTGASAVVISSRSGVTIGKHVNIGGNVRIFDHDFHSLDAAIRRSERDCDDCATRPISIGDDVFIGTQCIILKGVTIGDRAVIGAGSVVSNDIPADCIAAGNPAVVIKRLSTGG